MLEITASSARQWSRIGSRGVYGLAISDLSERKMDLIAMSADLGNSSGLDRFKAAHPDRFVNVGIAEQNLIGMAAGIAKEGFIVFASSFAPFISMRAAEQVRMNLGYMHLNVKAVAIGSGLSMGFLGNSHFGLEDAAVIRAIPGIVIITPADCSEIIKAVNALADYSGPAYLRLTGGVNNPIVYSSEYDFEIGKSINLKSGDEVVIFACGTMVHESLEAAKLLEERGVSTEVINMHTLRPLDIEAIRRSMKSRKLIVTIEEHSVIGGLGSAVAEQVAQFADGPPLLILGIPDEFGTTADYHFLLEKYGLVGEKIAKKIYEKFSLLMKNKRLNEL